MVKKFLLSSILLLALVLPLPALSMGVSASLERGFTFAYPLEDYLKTENGPLLRTSEFFLSDLEALRLNFHQGKTTVGVGLSYGYTYSSLPYGTSILRGYQEVGIVSSVFFQMDPSLDLGFKVRVLDGVFDSVGKHFLTADLACVPAFRLAESAHCSFSLVTPLTLSYKKDTLSLRFALGASLGLGAKEKTR
ncbi:MAG: hypothetical protein KBS81_04650 [Spirochaetales bacterium]|nr:hypothetical protein [Candidatus Physcosoma equi]